jgi:membrane-bound serine protease (ClpP class)
MAILSRLLITLLLVLVGPLNAIALDKIIVVKVNGAINSVAAEFIAHEIRNANTSSEELIVIQMDISGGLDTSIRKIIKAIQSSKIPVASFVSPFGASAVSSGTFIAIASHIAVMEPGTNIGMAHPLNLISGGGKQEKLIEEKIVNDASAYIRSLAEQRGRNSDWAELSVSNNVSVPAEEALRLNVIDLMVANLDSLVLALDKREVKVMGRIVTLNTADKNITFREMGARQRILDIISQPDVVYILMMFGLIGLFLELSSPGLILPGVVGSFSLILSFYAMQTLPISSAGFLLVILGVILLIAELNVMSYGLLSIGGAASIYFGSIMLVDSDDPAMQISKIVLYSTLGTAFFISIGSIYLANKSRQLRSLTGIDGLIGEIGVVKLTLNPKGLVLVHGEVWNAESNMLINDGENVVVEAVEGLKIKVRKIVE